MVFFIFPIAQEVFLALISCITSLAIISEYTHTYRVQTCTIYLFKSCYAVFMIIFSYNNLFEIICTEIIHKTCFQVTCLCFFILFIYMIF